MDEHLLRNDGLEGPMPRKGDRIGAIATFVGDDIQLLGFGVYVDDVPVQTAFDAFSRGLRDAGTPVPLLKLDDGQELYGFEAYWGPERDVQRRIDRATRVRIVSVESLRHSRSP